MANITPESVLERMCRGHLDCLICQERFIDPKLLKCRHNYCKTCLEDMMKAQPRDRQDIICCPACRQDTVIPKVGIAGLDGNFTLKAMVDEANQQEKLLKQQKSSITCELCVEKKQAISRCLDCSEYLCQECRTTHNRMKKTTTHEVVTIDDLRSGKATYESRYRKEVPKCKEHNQQDLIFYCVPCNKLICTAGAAVDHRSHEVQDISKVSTECKQQISDRLKKVEKRLKIFEAAKSVASKSSNKHMMMVSDQQTVIAQKADEEVARIRKNERRLQDQLFKISAKKGKQFQDLLTVLDENIKHAKDTLDRVKKDTFKIIHFDLLKMKDSILCDLQDAEGRSIPDPVLCMTSEDFKQSGHFSQADLDVLNDVKQRPPIQPRPAQYKKADEKERQKKVSDRETEVEAAITTVQVRQQVTEDEAAITLIEVSNQVTEDEAAITPVEKKSFLELRSFCPEQKEEQKEEDTDVPHVKKIDKTKWRRVIGGPQPNMLPS